MRVFDSGNQATDGLFGESKTDLIAIRAHNLLNMKESWGSVNGCYGKTNVIISVTLQLPLLCWHVTRWYSLPSNKQQLH